MSIGDAMNEQRKQKKRLNRLDAKIKDKKVGKKNNTKLEKVHDDADKVYEIRNHIINTFKNLEIGTKTDQKLPKWIKVTKERLNKINDIVENAKKK